MAEPRVRAYDTGAVVDTRGEPPELLARVSMAEPVTAAALALEAERVFWVRLLVRLLESLPSDPWDEGYERWLAETAAECNACRHFGTPCGGCQQGSVCDGLCTHCEAGEDSDDIYDYYDPDEDCEGAPLG